LWIVSGLVMWCSPFNVLVALVVGMTLLAFTILDETP
jgi:hypothetical protein